MVGVLLLCPGDFQGLRLFELLASWFLCDNTGSNNNRLFCQQHPFSNKYHLLEAMRLKAGVPEKENKEPPLYTTFFELEFILS